MSPDEQRVAELIRTAFKGVVLGNGVGLRQAQGLDDYASDAALAELRSRDEQHDWSKIAADDLNRCYSSLSFFDAEGMRFHLPAFLLSSLNGTFVDDILFTLANSGYYGLTQFELLNQIQRQAVREFLLFELEHADPEMLGPMLETALAGPWRE